MGYYNGGTGVRSNR